MQMDATPAEKIYVALGNNVLDGFHTLAWTLSKWNSHPISIVILHVKYDPSKHLLTLRKFHTFVCQFSSSLPLKFNWFSLSFVILFQLGNSQKVLRVM